MMDLFSEIKYVLKTILGSLGAATLLAGPICLLVFPIWMLVRSLMAQDYLLVAVELVFFIAIVLWMLQFLKKKIRRRVFYPCLVGLNVLFLLAPAIIHAYISTSMEDVL
ncbi:MAG: hypothetical protein II187_04895, partial [Treponema sp.]|nr:hypothetical protein [Treponema sp.]